MRFIDIIGQRFGKKDKLEKLARQVDELRRAVDEVAAWTAGRGEPGSLFDIGRLSLTSARDENIRQVRLRAKSTFVADDTVLCRALGRYKMYLAASDVGFGAHLMLDGYWEIAITEFIVRCVKPGMTVLDLGANFGYFTLLMADLVGQSGKICAFEPNPRANALLKRSVSINGFSSRVEIDERAVWNISGERIKFRIPKNEPKNARVTLGEQWTSEFSETQITTVSLDDLQIGKIDFIKADIEGAEQNLWAGMQGVLRDNPDVIFLLEFSPARCNQPRAILEQMERIFPLQCIGEDSFVRPTTIDQLLSQVDDWMLVLTSRQLANPG